MYESINAQHMHFDAGTSEQLRSTPFPAFGLGPQETLAYRKRFRGLIGVSSKVPLKDRSVLSLLYTPGVAAPCLEIAKEPLTSFDYTLRGNTIALISDGSSAFGFGNIGPLAALPMLEDACILFKTFGGVNAFPISLNTHGLEQIIEAGVAIWPTFGGFCLSSIASPRCFAVTDYLARAVNIPVLHAEQHATAATILGALLNALKLVGKTKEAVRIVINGSGPGGIGTARLLLQAGFYHILVCDRLGILERYRLHNMNWAKLDIARQTNPTNIKGTLEDALRGADVDIGLSSWSTPTPEMISSMAVRPVLFTLALPDPGITTEAARAAGAAVVATARPEATHALMNALVLPGIFRGALDVRATAITQEMLLAAAFALADLVPPDQLAPEHLVLSVMEYAVAPRVARVVAEAARRSGVARSEKDPAEIERQALATIYEGHRPVPRPSHQYANLQEQALELHKRYQGVLEIQPKLSIRDTHTLSSLYLHPGLPEATQQILAHPETVFDYTGKSMASTQYDVAVIGAGPGGYVAAIRAAQLGAKTAIIEKQYLGGTYLNVGCIPSKAMLHIADVMHNMTSLEDLGIILDQQPKFDMKKAITFKDKVVKRMTSGVGTLMKGNGIAVYDGLATVDASRTVTVTMNSDHSQQQFTADKIILATGSVPLMPPFPGIDGRNVINSDICWNLPKVPESIICVGGGIIGMELACMFDGIGSQVTVLEMLPNVLAPVDDGIHRLLVRILTKRGINIVTEAKVESIADEGDGKKVIASTPKGEKSFTAEYVLVAVSRPNTSGLERLMEQGLDNDRGRVRVNDKMETNLPGIYAIGDLVHGAGLAHVASMEGEVASDNAMGHTARMDYTVIPNPIYTFPEVAFVGLTEAQTKENYPEVRVERFPRAAIGKAVAMGETDGFTKVIFGKYDEIIGAHIIGPDATNLISEYSVAMRGELTANEIIETIHPHPTLSEGLREAILAVEGRPIHIPPKQTARAR